MERKTLQLTAAQHNWFMSYKTKRGFKNSESAFDEIRKLADEHFFDIIEEPVEETYFGLLKRHEKEFNEFCIKQVDKGNAEVLAIADPPTLEEARKKSAEIREQFKNES